MIWIILRIVFGAGFVYVIHKSWESGAANPMDGDLANAGYLSLAVILGIANGIAWAPYVGDKISGPITGMMTTGTFVERRNLLLNLIYWLQDHGFRRLTVFFCFLEGIHHPDRPTAFVVGLKNASHGSWFEKIYAQEVFRFDNARNCVLAYEALKQHDINPGRHRNPEINVLVHSLERAVKPDPAKLKVPESPKLPAMKRNRRIRLFGQVDTSADDSQDNEVSPSVSDSQQSVFNTENRPEEAIVMAHELPSRKLAVTSREWLARIGSFLRGN